ncbi:Rieske 2Fe-2S domain-containing protein [Streptomyces sp. NPDC048258]|uniref:Rieske 2Fe-2S domain-containing protein n=1 Tax=Streptomyces sp. NPDC048258 TaxID=3365527 RepID=UPI003721FE7E
MSVHSGWYLPAFLSELTQDVSPLDIGDRRLVAVRSGGAVRVFDADCPHRGAHLGHGGQLADGCLVCPFHGLRVSLGGADPKRSVREHQVIVAGDALFVRLSDEPGDDRGFTRAIAELSDTHPLVPAVTEPMRAPAELVVENAFDTDHFTALHKVYAVRGMAHHLGDDGELVMDGEFPMPASPWQGGGRPDGGGYVPRFYARAFSPHVVVTLFGPPEQAHAIVTAAVPDAAGGCVVRVAIGVREGHEGDLSMLIAGSKRALAEDLAVWEHLNPRAVPNYGPRDAGVAAFRAFCAGFPALADPYEGETA